MSENLSNHPRPRNRRASNLTPVTNGQIPRRRRRNEVSSSLPVRATRVRTHANFTEEAEYGQITNNRNGRSRVRVYDFNESHHQIFDKDLGIDKVTFSVNHGYIRGSQSHLNEIIVAAGFLTIDSGFEESPSIQMFRRGCLNRRQGATVQKLQTLKTEIASTAEIPGLELLFSAKLNFISIPNDANGVHGFRVIGEYSLNPTRIKAYHPSIPENLFSLIWRASPKKRLSLDGNDNWLETSTNLRNFDVFTSGCVYSAIGAITHSIRQMCIYLNNMRNLENIDYSGLLDEPRIRLKSCECYLPIRTQNAISCVNGCTPIFEAYSNDSIRDTWVRGSDALTMRFPNHTLKLYAKLSDQARLEVNIKQCSKALGSNMANTLEETLILFKNARRYAATQINLFLEYLRIFPEAASPDRLTDIFYPYFNDPGVRELFNLLVTRGSVAKADLATTEGKQAFERFRGKPTRPNILMGFGPNRRQYRYFATPGITPPTRRRR